MTIRYCFNEIFQHARRHSAFYRDLYKNLPDDISNVEQLPVVDQDKFWNAYNSGHLLCGELSDGIVFKSGGTTGNPKFSVFTVDEWEAFTAVFGEGMAKDNGIKTGDRVANIFYAGELYASFIFIMKSIENSGVKVVQYPLAGSAEIPDIVKTLKEFDINVLAGVPTSIMKIASYLDERNEKVPALKKVLYGGEALYDDQRSVLEKILPAVQFESIGWASVDAGHLGYFGKDCISGEHRTFTKHAIMEIVCEETGELIEEENRVGKILLTNLTRKLMPIIRYPVGDRGMWTEPKGTDDRKIKLAGRSGEGARVGPVTIYLNDLRDILTRFQNEVPFGGFQVLTNHFDGKDQLEIHLGLSHKIAEIAVAEQTIETAIYEQRSMLKDLSGQGIIHPVKVRIKRMDELATNPRTGKLKSLIDQRS